MPSEIKLNAWEKVIFRNYSLVPSDRIARAIGTSEKTVEEFAALTGLSRFKYNPVWRQKGFVTLIRNNWDILDSDRIAEMLDMPREKFDALLKDYDFLDVKLGEKPAFIPPVYGFPPADEEKYARIKAITDEAYVPPASAPFDFYRGEIVRCEESDFAVENRFVAPYSARYTDALLDDALADYPEEYLSRLAAAGINGIWLAETLRNLAPFPFDERYSPDYETRIRNLVKLIERCEKYGIGVYIYLNEPRSMPAEFFERFPSLRGHKVSDGEYCLCTSSPDVEKYIYDALKFVAGSAPKLKGIFTITMSENATNCYYNDAGYTDCPVCRKSRAYEVVARLNNLMCRAVKAGSPDVKYIANIWGWAEYRGWKRGEELKCIALLDRDVEIMCVSEFDKKFTRGGVTSNVIDYSISVIGPGEYAERAIAKARETGHDVWAKIQVNNSWELSAVPYLPVFDMMTEHVENLKRLGVKGMMMGWSLGGYPGGALAACSEACGKGEFSLSDYARRNYGGAAERALAAMKLFREGFEEYPFSLNGLYNGAQTLGPANLWSLSPDGRKSTMVCFSFDDDEAWAAPYGLETYIRQYEKLCKKWREGLDVLAAAQGNALFEELKVMAGAAYAHFFSTYKHAQFVKLKRDVRKNAREIEGVLREEYDNVLALYALAAKDSRIGFEMTNHYYYTPLNLFEKLLNIRDMLEELKGL